MILLSLAALACQGEKPAPDAGAPDAGPVLDAQAVYTAGPFTVDAGGEIVMCTFVQGTNDAGEDISSFIVKQSKGGHHLIVYTLDHPVNLPPVVCPQGGQPGWDYLFGTQDQEDEWDLPAGVGFQIQAHQQFAIETHYINATPDQITASGAFGLNYAPAGSVTERASVFYFGTENLYLPPGNTQAEAYCSPPDPVQIQAIVGHEHRFGTGVTVGLIPDGGSEQPIYQTQQWDSPPFQHFDGGITLGTSDTLHVTCSWDNTGTSTVTFPTEMCYAVGAYWPSTDVLFCAASGGTSQCYCGYGTPLDTGPGGSTVPVSVTLQSGIPNVVGDPADGAPIYCAFYRAQDWNGLQPAANAQAYYVNYVTGVSLGDPNAAAHMSFYDVTPGDYVATCFMDTIAGGSTPGTGDPTNLGGATFTAVAGDNPVVPVVLDFALP
jgi:hypothetical protein